MADTSIASTVNGLVKTIYADTWVDLIPEWALFYKTLKFQKANKLGDTYNQMVLLGRSHGVTYGGSTAAAFNLAEAIPMQTDDASVRGSEFVLRDVIAIGSLKRAMSTKEAFVNLWTLVYENMMDSIIYRYELATMWGGSATGTVATGGIGVCASSANASATSTVITCVSAEWAAGIFGGAETAKLSFYTTNTTLVSSGADSVFTISAVNIDSKTITVTGTATGITALDSAISGNANAVNIYFAGILSSTPLSSFGNEPVGLAKIISNTGTLFGINAASFNLWKGNSYSASSAAFNFGKATQSLTTLVSRGLKGDVCFYVSPGAWNNLNVNEAANRLYDSSYNSSNLEVGAKQISYYAQNGKITFEPHIYMKDGYAFALHKPDDAAVWRRVGSTEITNVIEGTNEMIVLSTDKNGVETRLYLDQAPFTPMPLRNMLVTGIVNNV